jgi:hypothetical protein
MHYQILSCLLVIVFAGRVNAQTVLTLQPNGANGKDAIISNIPGESTTNFGNSPDFFSESDPINFVPYARRGLIQFDLSSIPVNATVISAYLSFYGTGNHIVADNNGAFLYRVTQSWTESTVTWATQPAFTTTNFIYLLSSDSNNQSYLNIDARNIIQDMVANPATSFGFIFKQKYECTCNGKMAFASSDHATAAMRPKLVVTWAVCNGNIPAATLSPPGPTSICYGTTQQLTANAGTGFTYQWFRNGTFLSGGSSNAYLAGTSGAYTVKVTNPQGCTAFSAADTLNVILDNAHIETSLGSTTLGCANGGLTMNAFSTPGTNYQWLLNGTIAGQGQSKTSSIPGNYTCYMTSGSCNYLSNTIVSTQQVATMMTSGPNYFCDNDQFNMTVQYVNIGSFQSFQWQRDGIDIPGATGVGYGADTTGYYRCVISDPMCAGNTISQTFQVTSGVPPMIAVVSDDASNPVYLCPGEFTTLKVVDATTGLEWFNGGVQWQWFKNGNYYSSDPELFYLVSPGTYMAYLTTSCGISSSAPGLDVISSPNPSAYISHTGSLTFCSGSSVLLKAPAGNNYNYQWKKNGTDIPGATLSGYTAASGGTYKVAVTDAISGCSKTSGSGTVVTVNANPSATVTPQGPTAFCAGDSVLLKANQNNSYSYQWKKNNTNILNAITNKHYAKTAGAYKVKVTNTNGCTAISNTITVTVPCRDGNAGSSDDSPLTATVYPNPSSGDFNFEIEREGSDKTVVEIFDLAGRLVLSISTGEQAFTIEGKKLPAGYYSAVITNGTDKQTLKLLKIY